MKKKLYALYTQHQQDFKNLLQQFPGEDIAGPFLMSPNRMYSSSKRKLLVIGQETNNWAYHVENLSKQMKVYEDFNLGEKYRSTPFFNITRKVEEALGNEELSCAWTNLSKFDHNSARPQGIYKEAIDRLDIILLSELQIVNPEICLFYTGPAFDTRLQAVFKGVQFLPIPGFSLNQFCRLKHPNLPRHAYRSYHPKSLRLRKLESKFIDYMASI